MKHHKITNKNDIIKLKEFYEDDSIFEVLETGLDGTLDDLLEIINFEDWIGGTFVTIQHI